MTLHHGDCLDVMAAMEPESVDAIVTDPPYGLEFMGKEWDKLGGGIEPTTDTTWADRAPGATLPFGGGGQRVRYGANAKSMQAWHQQWAEAAYRVAKPSAYLLAFGGTRTVHRMTVALEDAGWIIRDMLVWAYASGFPKSKASLKPAWEPIVMARKPGPLRMLAIDECRIAVAEDEPNRRTTPSVATPGMFGVTGHAGTLGEGRWPANVILTDPIFDGGVEGVVGGGETSSGSRSGQYAGSGAWSGEYGPVSRELDGDSGTVSRELDGDSGTYSRFFLIPKSSRSDREPVLDEYAYQLHKESGECVVTPRRRAIGGATTRADSDSSMSSSGSSTTDPSAMDGRSTTSTATRPTTVSRTSSDATPSPTSASIPAVSSAMGSGGSPAGSAESSSLWEPPTGISAGRAGRSTDDADLATFGSSSSRSSCARCGKRLPRFSTHPTQKPTELMRHLVRLVTPSGGTVLDPFLGSGTTALAAEMEGFAWVGIEREEEYVRIAEARLNGTQRGLGLETA